MINRTLLIFLSTQILMINCEYLEVKKSWDDTKIICGYTEIKNLSESLKTELLNQQYKGSDKLTSKRRNEVVITYNDFRCCLKKTVVKNLKTVENQRKCMKILLKCIIESLDDPCIMRIEDYIQLALSNSLVLVWVIAAIYSVVISCFVLYHIHIAPNNDRTITRRRAQNHS